MDQILESLFWLLRMNFFLKMHFSFQYPCVYKVSQIRSTIKPELPKSKPKGMTLTGLLEGSVRRREVNDFEIKGVFSIRCHFLMAIGLEVLNIKK